MKTNNVLLAIMASTFVLVGCDKAMNSERSGREVTVATGVIANAHAEARFNNKVDILFVIDNSASMRDEQQKLARDISRFADGLGSFLDWRVAVTPVWDAWTRDPVRFPRHSSPQFIPTLNGISYGPGELLPVRNPVNTDEVLTGPNEDKSRVWVSQNTVYPGHDASASEPAYKRILRNHLLIGVREFADGGPSHEEIIYPMLAAFGPHQYIDNRQTRQWVSNVNEGFSRPDALLVIIAITDAYDSSQYNETNVKGFLDRYKGVGNYMIYTATATAGCADAIESQNTSRADTGLLTRLVQITNSDGDLRTFNICSANYGARLADMGRSIRHKRGAMEFFPTNRPTPGYPFEVRFGFPDGESVSVPASAGWSYDEGALKIVVRDTAQDWVQTNARSLVAAGGGFYIVNPRPLDPTQHTR